MGPPRRAQECESHAHAVAASAVQMASTIAGVAAETLAERETAREWQLVPTRLLHHLWLEFRCAAPGHAWHSDLLPCADRVRATKR